MSTHRRPWCLIARRQPDWGRAWRPRAARPIREAAGHQRSEADGELELVIATRAGGLWPRISFIRAPCGFCGRITWMSPGRFVMCVVNPGGAYLGADLYVIDVEVAAGAKLLLTTQSATKVYRTPGSFAEQRMRLRLGEGAQLELAPDQLIAYREASYRQNTHITMHPTSSLVTSEVVTPGWSPDGAVVPLRGTAPADRDPDRIRGAGRAAGARQPADPPSAARRHRPGIHGGLQPPGITDRRRRAR